MFSFFKKKNSGVKVEDIVWMTEEIKFSALTNIAAANPDTIFIAWFDDSFERLKDNFSQNGVNAEVIHLAQQTSQRVLNGKPVVFIEHYPLHDKEDNLYHNLGLEKAVVHSGLDEPFLKLFGSEKIIDLMKKMGASDEESIQHSMVSSSIKNAQEKLETRVLIDKSARSQGDWIRQNLAH